MSGARTCTSGTSQLNKKASFSLVIQKVLNFPTVVGGMDMHTPQDYQHLDIPW